MWPMQWEILKGKDVARIFLGPDPRLNSNLFLFAIMIRRFEVNQSRDSEINPNC
jgi:hypothetical protein